MLEGSFDTSEALLKHLDIIIPKLDYLHEIIGSQTQFAELVKGKAGASLDEFIQSYDSTQKGKKPKMSDSLHKQFDPYIKSITPAVIIIDYAYSWAIKARAQLNAIVEQSCGLQLRCGYSLSIQTIKLFINYVKILTFFRIHSNCSIVIRMAPHFNGMKEESVKMLGRTRDICTFLHNCCKDVYNYVNQSIMPLREPLIQFISAIGPFLIQIMGPWPVVEWENLSIFNRPPTETESTLPESHTLIIQNLEVMRELIICFVLVYSTFVLKHPLFNSLITAVLSDCTKLSITRLVSLSISEIFDKLCVGDAQKIYEQLKESIENDSSVKMEVGHKQRITHLVYLLRDIVDVGTFNPSVLPLVIYQLLPLVCFAHYEINCALTEKTIHGGVTSLVDLLCNLGILFDKYDRIIKRFFLFNLVTVDNTFLLSLAQSINNPAAAQWQQNICNLFFKLSDELKKLDLEQFDNGTNYDMQPFLSTIGRLQYYFSAVQKKETATFLYPAFEHLEVISLHSQLVSSPLEVFLKHSPIHHLWNHSEVISQYVKDVVGGPHNCSRFACLFAFFNVDTIALSILPSYQDKLTETLEKMRVNMLGYTQVQLSNYMNRNSVLLKITEQNRIGKIFDPEPFIPSANSDNADEETQFREDTWQLKEFLTRMPGIINFNGKDFEFSEYIASQITHDLAPLLFKNPSADPHWLDSVYAAGCQSIWSVYTQLGVSFPKRLLETRYMNSIYTDQVTFLQQISLIREDCMNLLAKRPQPAPTSKKDKKKQEKDKGENEPEEIEEYNPNMKLVTLFEDRLKQFISQDYHNCFYLPHSRSFENFNEMNYLAVQFVSEASFRRMIDSLGLHAGFNLDRILIAEIAKSMGTIYQVYTSLGKTINTWYGSFRGGTDDWAQAAQSPEIGKAADEIVKLGVMLMVRDLLRSAMHEAVDQSAPGLINLVRPAYMRTIERLSEKEDLMMEMISAEPTFFFIKMALDTMGIEKTTDSIQFFFFLALLMINPKWDNVQFLQDHEIITNNLHVIPASIDAFINVLSTFCQTNDEKIVATGMQFYFTVLQHIVQLKRTREDLRLKSTSAFIILADLFPKYVHSIEYGRISHSFPNSVVSEAYRQIESNGEKMMITVRLKKSNEDQKEKKGKKGQKGKRQ